MTLFILEGTLIILTSNLAYPFYYIRLINEVLCKTTSYIRRSFILVLIRIFIHHVSFSLDCSIIGATIIAIGFYTVMWGKAKEELGEYDVDTIDLESTTTQKHPLLQSYKTRVTKK